MSFNRQAIEYGLQQKITYGSGERDPWSMFPTIKIFGGETHRGVFLTPLAEMVPLWIHEWKGMDRTRTLCPKMHHGVNCDICATMKDKFGNNCRPKHMMLALFWDYSNIGKTWTPESGPNKGVPQPVYPFGVVSIPAGEERVNWSKLQQADANGYGFPNSPNQQMIWEFSHVPEVGFQPPSTVPIEVLGATLRAIDPAIVQWLHSSTQDDRIAQLFATVHGVDWQAWGLVEPQRYAVGGQNNAQSGGNQQSVSRGRGSKRNAQTVSAPNPQLPPQQIIQPNAGLQTPQGAAGFPNSFGSAGQVQTVPGAVGTQNAPVQGFNQAQQVFQQTQQVGVGFPGAPNGDTQNISGQGSSYGIQNAAPQPAQTFGGAPSSLDPTQLATERAAAAFANLNTPTPAQEAPQINAPFPGAFVPPAGAQQPAVDDEIAKLKAQLAALQQGQQPQDAEQASQRRNLVTG